MTASAKSRVLVVDDELPLVAALRGTLIREGYDVSAVAKPSEALALLREQKFEILLTDLQMPDMDGIELLRAALALDPFLVGILMTGHGTVDRAVEAMKAGAFDFVIKPFKLSVLLSSLTRAIDVRRLRVENDRLQQHLQTRTAELETANKELEAFTYSVSHDLQAPLRAIAGFNQLIQEELGQPSTDSIREYAARVDANVERMSRIIEDLLRLAKTAGAEVKREPLDLSHLAREIAKKIENENRGRVVKWHIEPELTITADPGLLRIAMDNLLSNAWKYTSKVPEALITVGAEAGPNGDRVFYVRDNGAGFDMAQVARLFRPFERLHSDREFSGSGVGLATVQRIIQKHGGRIWGAGEQGKGATFRFTLPS
jgi:two-component system sensor histidine kinase/response regulator